MNSCRYLSIFLSILFGSLAFSGDCQAEKKRTFSVAVKAPATNYRIKIQNVYQAGKEIWVVARVKKIGDIGGAAITTLKDSVAASAPAGKVRTFILGKTWNWAEPKTYEYVSDQEMLKLILKQRKAKALKDLYVRTKDSD